MGAWRSGGEVKVDFHVRRARDGEHSDTGGLVRSLRDLQAHTVCKNDYAKGGYCDSVL